MKLLVVLIVSFSSTPLGSGLRRDRWIVWNVGQGLWITVRRDSGCAHFDAGGERRPFARVRELCLGRENRVALSHADWDHVGGLRALRAGLGRVCLTAPPPDAGTAKARKRALWEGLPACPLPAGAEEVRWRRHGRTPNHASRVFVYERRFVMPGDSPSSEEKLWAFAGADLPRAAILVLGHHGSRTSTSPQLLSRMRNLKIAIASARRRKYGHPHPQVVERLRKARVGLLRTEDWGHLEFEL